MKIRPRKVSLWTQWLAAFHVNIMTMLATVSLGLMSPFLAQMLGPNPPFKVTKDQTTWVASLLHTTIVIGSLLATITTVWVGSKLTMHSCGLYFICASLSLTFATSIEAVYANLLCNGLAMGVLFGTIPVYIGEISDSKVRGGLMTFAIDGFPVGQLAGVIMGTYLSTTTIGIICLVFSIVYLVSFSFFPQTPYHLVRRNKHQEASKSLEWYNRGIAPSATVREVEILTKYAKSKERSSIISMLKEVKKPENIGTLIKLNIAFFLEKLSSMGSILEYLEILFKEAKVTVIAPSSLVIIISVVGVITGWIAIYTSDRFDRRKAVFWSCIVMAISFVAWGLSYQLLQSGASPSILQYVVIISAVIYRTCINLGLTPIIPTIMSEMLSPDVRSVGVCICNLNMTLCLFISAKNFQYLLDALKYQYVFYLNALVVFLLGIYARKYLCVSKNIQETKVTSNDEENQELQVKLG